MHIEISPRFSPYKIAWVLPSTILSIGQYVRSYLLMNGIKRCLNWQNNTVDRSSCCIDWEIKKPFSHPSIKLSKCFQPGVKCISIICVESGKLERLKHPGKMWWGGNMPPSSRNEGRKPVICSLENVKNLQQFSKKFAQSAVPNYI